MLNWRRKTTEKEKTNMVLGNNGRKCNKTSMSSLAVTLSSFIYLHTKPLYYDASAIVGTKWSKLKHVCNTISSWGRSRKNSWQIKCTVLRAALEWQHQPLAARAELLLSAFQGQATGKWVCGCPPKMHSEVIEILPCTAELQPTIVICSYSCYFKIKQYRLIYHKTKSKAFQVLNREEFQKESLWVGRCGYWQRLSP